MSDDSEQETEGETSTLEKSAASDVPPPLKELDDDVLKDMLIDLRQSHRQLDKEIQALRLMGAVDMLKIGRMKKLKLKLKDRIAYIEDLLTPDIIA